MGRVYKAKRKNDTWCATLACKRVAARRAGQSAHIVENALGIKAKRAASDSAGLIGTQTRLWTRSNAYQRTGTRDTSTRTTRHPNSDASHATWTQTLTVRTTGVSSS
eukprot:637090-Prymnesium_polylepis.1